MQYQHGRRATVIPLCGLATGELSTDTVEQQLKDFRDGKTNGEELLHSLYDYVLDEPIPERMRELLHRPV